MSPRKGWKHTGKKGRRRRLTLRVSDELGLRLERIAKASGESVNEIACFHIDRGTLPQGKMR